MEFTFEEIIEATGAQVLKNETKKGEKFSFSTDTRTIKPGQIYLPLKGANFDGEKFIDKAIESGAIGYFSTEDDIPYPNTELILQVKDTLIAYLEIARHYKRKVNPKTVAITGSSGKTTTKEMAFSVSSVKFKTHKTKLNYNNEIGLCKTLLEMPNDTEVLIVEMGMRGLGEIELLSKYAEPGISIIANVGTAHIGRLGSRENIAKAKCEIVKHLKKDGILIAHDDNIIKNCIESQNLKINSKYFSLENTEIIERKVGYTKFLYKGIEYELNIEGDYNVQNALSAIEMGIELGLTQEEITKGLKNYTSIEKRWETQEIKGFKLINDSYNANPESVKAAIEAFLSVYQPPLAIILGNMGELGEKETEYHTQVGDFLAEKIKNKKGIEVVTVGKLAREISKVLITAGFESQNFDKNSDVSKYVLENIKSGTTIILKASRSMKFEEIINTLKEN